MSCPSVIFVSGPSHSGKTTLIELLIPRLRQAGFRVGTIKHAHDGCDMDHPGKDSWRHAQAGASAVTIIAPRQTALLIQTEKDMQLSQVVGQMAPYVDLILVEGYKNVNGPKILLEPLTQGEVFIKDGRCRIGIQPDRLSTHELERITEFLVTHAK